MPCLPSFRPQLSRGRKMMGHSSTQRPSAFYPLDGDDCHYTYCLSRSNFFGGKQLRVYEGMKSNHALRSNARRTWCPREGSRNAAIRRALSPSHPCARGTAGVYGRLRGVAPLRHHTASRDTPVSAHVRSNDPIASDSSRCEAPLPLLFSPSGHGLATTGCSSEAIDMTVY